MTTATHKVGIFTVDINTDDTENELHRLLLQIASPGLKIFLDTQAWPWLEQRTQRRFTGEGDDAVGMWVPLAFPTYGYRIAGGFPPVHPINVRTGALKDFALTHEVETQVGGLTLSQPKKGGTIETQKKFRHAQRGGVSLQGHPFPARPVAGLGMLDARRIEQRLFQWVTTGGNI